MHRLRRNKFISDSSLFFQSSVTSNSCQFLPKFLRMFRKFLQPLPRLFVNVPRVCFKFLSNFLQIFCRIYGNLFSNFSWASKNFFESPNFSLKFPSIFLPEIYARVDAIYMISNAELTWVRRNYSCEAPDGIRIQKKNFRTEYNKVTYF